MSERAGLFDDDDLDVSDFTPSRPAPAAPLAAVRKVAEQAAFASREAPQKWPRRAPRCYRTGRNALFSCKADPDVIDEFYAITEAQGWVMGETLQHAVEALRREIARGEPGRGTSAGSVLAGRSAPAPTDQNRQP